VGELFTPIHLMVLAFYGMFLVVGLVIPFWQIFKKAGMSPALSILMMIPFVNFIMLYILAFSKWNTNQPPSI